MTKNSLPSTENTLSTAKLFLFKGIESKLEQIENAPNPNVKKQWKDYELLRLWTRRYKQTGFSPWPATVCASCLIVVGGLWIHAHWPKSYFYVYPDSQLLAYRPAAQRQRFHGAAGRGRTSQRNNHDAVLQ
jgi:hypothetical protein